MNSDSNEVNQILTISDAHKSAIWCVKWSNSKFGMILGSCGFDQKVHIWEINETDSNTGYEYK